MSFRATLTFRHGAFVFDAAETLSIPVKSHSSSISEGQAETIIGHLVAEGHLAEDLAAAYKTKAAQKEKKPAGSDKPAQARPASRQAKPTGKTLTVRLKTKAVLSPRPTPAQAAARKPTPGPAASAGMGQGKIAAKPRMALKPSSVDQKLHRQPSQPAKEPASGPFRLASTATTRKDLLRPTVIRTKTADQPATRKTTSKGKATPPLVKSPSADAKPLQKPKLVRPTASPVAPASPAAQARGDDKVARGKVTPRW